VEFDKILKLINEKVFFRNPMNPDDIEGEEAGDSFVNAEEEVKFTPFNMKEELEEVSLKFLLDL
jgi:hypothetical protein